MSDAELCFTPIEELAPQIKDRKLSPVELTRAVLDRLERLEPKLNAFVTVTADAAMEAAKTAEREIGSGLWRGPLHGIPISLKDLYDTAGVKTTASSRILADRVPAKDSTVTERLKVAGAVIVGKNNMFEFAYGSVHPDYGPSNNPWDLARSTGGSSSGSGAAVAAGIGPGSMGSDTGGSIRLPASFCGLVGHKPTYGLVPRTGVVALSWSLDHCGPMTRTVWDCAAMLHAVAGYDPDDPGSGNEPVADYLAALDGGVKGMQIGVPTELPGEVDPQVDAAYRAALDALRGAGATVREVKLPDLQGMALANLAIITAEAASFHRGWFRQRAADYAPATRERLEAGMAMLATDFLAAQRARRVLVKQLAEAMVGLDLLALPTSGSLPPTNESFLASRPMGSGGDVILRRGGMTGPYNLAGLPAVSVPAGYSDNGLPIGLQLVGHAWQDGLVLRAARAYEKATGWHKRRPPID